MSADDSSKVDDELNKLLRNIQIEPGAGEGLRLVTAFLRIKNQVDRRAVIELAERLAK